MNRRSFIKTSVVSAVSAGLYSFPTPLWAANQVKLTILHTNDVHSRIDPYPNDGRPNAGLGGMARRATLVKQVRSQEKNVLLLDSGDIWQGTPYFNIFDGALEYQLMSQMAYDAATLGNHDFDNGLEGLQRQLPKATFPFVNANYDFSQTILKNTFKPYKVFEKEGIKIGVFGLGVELVGLVDQKNFGRTVYLDPVQRAAETVKQLKETEKCDFIICLSHLGYSYSTTKIDDRKLAKQIPQINVILGGHSHTFMDAPEVVKHTQGGQTFINQVGKDGLFLGRLDFVFNRKTRQADAVATVVLPVSTQGKTS